MGPETPTAESKAIILLASALANEIKLDERTKYIEVDLVENVVSAQERSDLKALGDDYVDRCAAREGLLILCITAQNEDETMDFHIYSIGLEKDRSS